MSTDSVKPTPTSESLLSEDYLVSLEQHFVKAEHYCEDMKSLQNLFQALEADPSLRNYALEKFGVTDVVSTEDVNRAAAQAWDRVKINLLRFQSDLFGYAKVIQSGADRLVERLDMLSGIAEKANKVPFKDQIQVKKNQKFSINGTFQPHDIRPLMEDTNNTFDFYDKVLVPFFGQVDKLLQTVEVNQTWAENTVMRFDLFSAGKWMKNFTALEQPDDRFKASAFVVKGVTAQGEKALYYSGPVDTKTENVKDWNYFINTIRGLRFRYIKVPGQEPLNEADNKIDVGNATTVRQRLSYLRGVAKRIQSRKGYDQKISTELRKIERSAEQVRNNIKSMRVEVDDTTPEEESSSSRPNVTNVVKDISTIMTSLTRVVTDYNNAMAGQLRLAGALGFIADLELKAYEAPLEKPTVEIKEKLDT